MNWLLASLGVLTASTILGFLPRKEFLKKIFGCGGVFAASLLGIIPAFQILMSGDSFSRVFSSPLPGLSVTLGVDPLSAFFLVAIFGLSLPVSIYAWGYYRGQGRLLPSLPFFPLLVATMAAVVVARDGFFFILCWEVMSLSSFFLVSAEHEAREVRHAGWITLIATHLATAFLMAFFVLLFRKTGSFSFEEFAGMEPLPATLSGLLFVFAVVGFGTKAGIFPFHVWLPHAHPAAPSPVSALMSGVMIKTGIYGILRTVTFLGVPPLWWGELLIGLGVLSAVLGVLYALMQHDLKRLLAYHSVENIGIIVIGIGLGLIGRTWNQPVLMILGFGGALFHVWNHAIFKGLLFLSAGGVVHATHIRMIDRMGGLIKKMPITGATFLIASIAICGLPPLNGFISEWLIYIGLFKGVTQLFGTSLFFSIAGIIGIAFAGGLAVACFTKVVGVIFLGEPRSEEARQARELSFVFLAPMAVLAFLCLAIGLFPQFVWPFVLSALHGIDPSLSSVMDNRIPLSLGALGAIFLFFIGFSGLLILFGRFSIRRSAIRSAPTWDCGYEAPSPSMQYTASSFAEPLGAIFRSLLRPRTQLKKPGGLFPAPGGFLEHVEDLGERRLFKPLFNFVKRLSLFGKKIQPVHIQGYLTLIFITLVTLLLWEVWIGI